MKKVLFLVIITLNFLAIAGNQNSHLPIIKIGNQTFKVEIANNPQARERGLMYRNSLDSNKGMLFVFPLVDYQCFWMKNTAIPLTALFISAEGKLINHADMKPFDESRYCSIKPAKYVIEINQGILSKNNLTPKTPVTIPKNIFAW